MSINYMAEITQKKGGIQNLWTPVSGVYNITRSNNIYEMYVVKETEENYWTAWGGWFDNLERYELEIYFLQWFVEVPSVAYLLMTMHSFYIDRARGMIMINIPKHPWLYEGYQTNAGYRMQFLSAPLHKDNPSDLMIEGGLAEVRLAVPSVPTQLGDNVNGVVKYNDFSFTLHNNDGKFDGFNIFNTPAYIRKAIKDNPTYDDFKVIRYGLVESTPCDMETLKVSCAEIFRGLDEEVCVLIDETLSVPVWKDGVIGKKMPLVFGTADVDLTEVGSYNDGEYKCYIICSDITSLIGIYDEDDAAISYIKNGLVIYCHKDLKAKYARVTGRTSNRIGAIIRDLMIEKSNIPYNDLNWDKAEADAYVNNSDRVNIVFTSGTVKSAIAELLKNDMAFLIQKSYGLLTLRKWGTTYATRELPETMFVSYSGVDNKDAQKNYFTECNVNYDYSPHKKEYNKTALYKENAAKAEELYSKRASKDFDTKLITEDRAINLAARLSERFSFIKDTVDVAIGVDTSEWQLLDNLHIAGGVSINGRVVSKFENWVITKLDPAQDKLTMEAI